MDIEVAKGLASRIAETMMRWDPYSYADTVADYDNNEGLLLEQTVKDLTETPEVVINYLLEIMDCMLDEM